MAFTERRMALVVALLVCGYGGVPFIAAGRSATQTAQGPSALPEDIKARVLEALGFQRPISKKFLKLFSSPGSRNLFAAMIDDDLMAAQWQTKLLIPKGYLVKQATKTERGQLDWNEYAQSLSGGITDLKPTQKLRPYLSVASSGEASVTLGNRVIDSIDYSNRWQMNGLDTWSFTFTYHIEPVLP